MGERRPGLRRDRRLGPLPVPDAHDCNERCGDEPQHFVHDRLLRDWVAAVTGCVRVADPNHLVASPRLTVDRPKRYRFCTGGADHWIESPQALIETAATTSAAPRSTSWLATATFVSAPSP